MTSPFAASTQAANPITTQYVPDTVAARIIGSTPPTLRRWRHEGRHLRYFKVGASVRYRISDLEEYLAKRVIEATGKARPQEAAA